MTVDIFSYELVDNIVSMKEDRFNEMNVNTVSNAIKDHPNSGFESALRESIGNMFSDTHAIMLLGQVDNEIIMLKNRAGDENTLGRSRIWKKNSKVAIVGTPNDIIKEIKRYIIVGGVRYFTIHFPDLPDLRSLNLFAKSVIPYFRNGQLK